MLDVSPADSQALQSCRDNTWDTGHLHDCIGAEAPCKSLDRLNKLIIRHVFGIDHVRRPNSLIASRRCSRMSVTMIRLQP